MIRNGQIWQSPSKLLAILQEISADMWIVLGTPAPVCGGGTAMQPVHFTVPVSKRTHAGPFLTRANLEEQLDSAGWVHRKDLSLDWM